MHAANFFSLWILPCTCNLPVKQSTYTLYVQQVIFDGCITLSLSVSDSKSTRRPNRLAA